MSQKLVLTPLVEKFCRAIDHKTSAVQYGRRLNNFDSFLRAKFKVSVDEFVESFKLNSGKFDVYDVLSEYRISLRATLAKNTVATRIMTARHFLEYNYVPIISTIFRLKVKPPKKTNPVKTPLAKADVRKIILASQNPRLHTYVITLAATGMRAAECLSILTKDINFEEGTVYLREEYTKTKTARTVFLTKECIKQLEFWRDYRNRVRRGVDKNGKVKYHTKPLQSNHLFFSTGRFEDVQNPKYLYRWLSSDFAKTLDRIGLNERYDNLGKRHKITLHSFRAFVKTTISDLGYHDFSEYFIGHKHSTYWNKPEAEKLELFRKVEPYLTYLTYDELEAHGADIETKLSEKDTRISQLEKQMATIKEQTQKEAFEFMKSYADKEIAGVKTQLQESLKSLRKQLEEAKS